MKITRQTFDECMFPCYSPLDFVITRAKGSYVWDDNGNEYLDLTAGIAVNSLGHCPKLIAKTLKKQSERLLHCSNIFANRYTLTLARELQHRTPFERFFFVNSGAEANEAALKLARRYAFDKYGEHKDEIISFTHSFHGRTFFTVTVGGQDKYSQGFGPRPGAVTHLPYNDLEAVKAAVSDKTCAIMVEPVQGEGGIIPAAPGYLKGLQEIAHAVNALLIFDEVQTGNGRTGKLYAYEHSEVQPDILATAKGLGGGLPIGAVMTSADIASHFGPGTHGSTFGGNPLICACAVQVLRRISEPKFLEGVTVKGGILAEGLQKIGERTGMFKEVRGLGLLQGAVLADAYADKAGEIQRCLAPWGVLILTAGSDVLRFAPALNIRKAQLKEALKRIEAGLTDYLKIHQI